MTSLWCHHKCQFGASPLNAVELRQEPVHVDLAAVRDDGVALESVDVNHTDETFLPVGARPWNSPVRVPTKRNRETPCEPATRTSSTT